MANPVVHFEIRAADPDGTRSFFGKLFGWTFPGGGMPGYSYVDTGVARDLRPRVPFGLLADPNRQAVGLAPDRGLRCAAARPERAGHWRWGKVRIWLPLRTLFSSPGRSPETTEQSRR